MKKILSIALLLSGIAHAAEKKSAPRMVRSKSRKASPQEATAYLKQWIAQLKSQKQTPTVIHQIKVYEKYLASYEDSIKLENTYP